MSSPGPPRGILRGVAPDADREHRRVLPSPALAPFVAHFWWVRWSLAEPQLVETLPHPAVHLVFEHSGGTDRAEIAGVSTRRFARQLVGRGHVFGIKFRPTAAQPLLRVSMALLANRVVPLADLVPDGDHIAQAVFAAPTFAAKVGAVETHLAARLAPLSDAKCALRDLVERLASDRTLLRAEDAAALLDVDLRTLQRRFRHAVGASPKWVIQRYRLLEAAEQLKRSRPPSLALLAATLGYADQAHFSRDFKAIVGRTPRQFRTDQQRA